MISWMDALKHQRLYQTVTDHYSATSVGTQKEGGWERYSLVSVPEGQSSVHLQIHQCSSAINRHFAPGPQGPILNQKSRVSQKIHKITREAAALAQWCTSQCRQPRACIRTPGPIQGAPCAPWMVCQLGFESHPDMCNSSFSFALVLVKLVCQNTPHQTLEQPLQSVDCGSFSFVLAANDNSLENPRASSSIDHFIKGRITAPWPDLRFELICAAQHRYSNTLTMIRSSGNWGIKYLGE